MSNCGSVKARYAKLIPDPEEGIGNWGGPSVGLSQVRFTRLGIEKEKA